MTTSLRCIVLTAACLLWAGAAGAQTTPNASSPASQTSTSQSPPSSDTATRPATTTFYGDTGLWYVPTAEILPNGKFSVSGYRRGTNWVQGYQNVADFAGTFGFGIKDRAEVFGSFLFDTRIDRDVRPLFTTPAGDAGGVVNNYPLVNDTFTGNHLGDLWVGFKVSPLTQLKQSPVSLGFRGLIKVPTASDSDGVGTGQFEYANIHCSLPYLRNPDLHFICAVALLV